MFDGALAFPYQTRVDLLDDTGGTELSTKCIRIVAGVLDLMTLIDTHLLSYRKGLHTPVPVKKPKARKPGDC